MTNADATDTNVAIEAREKHLAPGCTERLSTGDWRLFLLVHANPDVPPIDLGALRLKHDVPVLVPGLALEGRHRHAVELRVHVAVFRRDLDRIPLSQRTNRPA